MSKQYIFLPLLLLLFLGRLDGQSIPLLHLSQPFYVSGEVIWYKLYLPQGFPAGPKVITVSLLDGQGKLVDQSFLRRKQQTSLSGYYPIPYQWKSGVYRLVLNATQEKGHEPILLAEALVPIYDDLGAQPESRPEPTGELARSPEMEELQVEITTEKDIYRPQSTARLEIRVRDRNGQPVPADLSVSVYDQNLFPTEEAGFSTLYPGNSLPDTTAWEEDITLRGHLLDPGRGTPISAGNVAAYLIRDQRFLYAKADSAGRFTLDLPEAYGDYPIHMMGFVPEEVRVRLDQKPNLDDREASPLAYPPAVVRYLEQSRKRKLIHQLYGRLEQSYRATFPQVERPELEADSPVRLDEYDAFPDLPTMVRDLSIPIRFRNWEGDRLTARVFDPSQMTRSYYPEGPLYIVDGMLTRDGAYIAELDIDKIERFDLYYAFDRLLRQFGPIARYGLVMIQSRNRDIEVPEADQRNFFRIQGFQAEVAYPVPARDPDTETVQIRPALYWHPKLATNAQGELNLSLPLTDDRSRFRIEVLVQDREGRRARGAASFSVK